MTPEELSEYRYLCREIEQERNKLHRLERKRRALAAYIDSIDDSFMRQLLTYRYIDGLSWTAVAMRLGGGNTADSVRMAHKRFLQK